MQFPREQQLKNSVPMQGIEPEKYQKTLWGKELSKDVNISADSSWTKSDFFREKLIPFAVFNIEGIRVPKEKRNEQL